MSHDYEHTIANGIEEQTPPTVGAYRCGYSGNSKHPQPDVIVTGPQQNYALELKKRQAGTAYIDGEDVEQIAATEGPQTVGYLVVKFPNREPVVVRYFSDVYGEDGWEDMSTVERFAALFPEPFGAAVTDGGNLRIEQPSTDGWSSAQAGRDDVTAILDGAGIPHKGDSQREVDQSGQLVEE